MNIHVDRLYVLLLLSVAVFFSGCTHEIKPTMEKAVMPDRAARSSLELHMVSTGEYDTLPTQLFPPRLYCYENIPQHAKNICGTREVHLWKVGVQAGHKCGYEYYVFVCLNP